MRLEEWQTATNIVMQWTRTCRMSERVGRLPHRHATGRTALSRLMIRARCGCCNFYRRLHDRGQEILVVFVWIVSLVRKPLTFEEIPLPGDRTTLHVDAIDEAVLNVRRSPIPAPDEAATLGELS